MDSDAPWALAACSSSQTRFLSALRARLSFSFFLVSSSSGVGSNSALVLFSGRASSDKRFQNGFTLDLSKVTESMISVMSVFAFQEE